jgi:NAD(P)H-nitrite reductase large subunit
MFGMAQALLPLRKHGSDKRPWIFFHIILNKEKTMLKDGEKGVVLQRDKTTYALVPHLPLGVVTADQLRKLADVADTYKAQAIKVTSATRIAIVGIQEEDVDRAWADLGMNPGAAVGLCVRSIKACPGNTFCRLGQQDALGLGGELDSRYHGHKLPGKFKIGVAGCPNQCAEPSVKDLGFMGKAKGWTVLVGGNAASKPRLGVMLTENLSSEEALRVADNIVNIFEKQGKKGERLGRFIDRIGFDSFKKDVVPA